MQITISSIENLTSYFQAISCYVGTIRYIFLLTLHDHYPHLSLFKYSNTPQHTHTRNRLINTKSDNDPG